MDLVFKLTKHGGWVGEVGQIRLFLDDAGGEMNRAQAELAERVMFSLSSLQAKASAYLDLFVDRTRACGGEHESWWLDEIDFRDPGGASPNCYALLFTLVGDDGGLWTVEMRAGANEHRPFRFERLQG